jgi:hypothetical protein
MAIPLKSPSRMLTRRKPRFKPDKIFFFTRVILTGVFYPGKTPPMQTPEPHPLPNPQSCTAFVGGTRLASGALAEVAVATQLAGPEAAPLVFDDATGRVIDLDLRGGDAAIRQRYAVPAEPEPRKGPGRPKLGVTAREVTLLPRHWDWLGKQPGGASVALRKLVETAQRSHADRDRARAAQESAYRFMSAMAGNEPGFEEATRALFARDRARFDSEMASWPADLRTYAARLAADCFETK